MTQTSAKIFITDCEGPVTKNDNAAELAEEFIPAGHRFFAKISLYDDYLAEVAKRPGYKAGDTLRLILPFFKAFGLSRDKMVEFSARNILIIPDADHVLQDLLEKMPCYIVSTSYSAYVEAVCNAIDFPFENTCCTEVDPDAYLLDDSEAHRLRGIHSAILDLPDFAIPSTATSVDDLTEEARRAVQVLDEVFRTVLPGMRINRIVNDVNPVGGKEKARAIKEIAASQGVGIENVLYVGDSITDVDAFRLVRAKGGIAISFNGNDWAVREADFAVTARNALPIGWLADLFIRKGREGFQDLMMTELTETTAQAVSEKSCRVRKEVRTEKIGSLG